MGTSQTALLYLAFGNFYGAQVISTQAILDNTIIPKFNVQNPVFFIRKKTHNSLLITINFNAAYTGLEPAN